MRSIVISLFLLAFASCASSPEPTVAKGEDDQLLAELIYAHELNRSGLTDFASRVFEGAKQSSSAWQASRPEFRQYAKAHLHDQDSIETYIRRNSTGARGLYWLMKLDVCQIYGDEGMGTQALVLSSEFTAFCREQVEMKGDQQRRP